MCIIIIIFPHFLGVFHQISRLSTSEVVAPSPIKADLHSLLAPGGPQDGYTNNYPRPHPLSGFGMGIAAAAAAAAERAEREGSSFSLSQPLPSSATASPFEPGPRSKSRSSSKLPSLLPNPATVRILFPFNI